MSSKFVSAPTMVSDIENKLAQYGVQADISELGLALMAGMVAFGLAKSVLSAG